MILKPDKIEKINGVEIYDYLLVNHNTNKIDLPDGNRKKTVAITIHNTDWINVSSGTTPAEQYTRATINGNMKTTRVNYYVDDIRAWRNMSDDYVNWTCADGTSNPNSGNNTSVAIECIMKGNDEKSKKSEDNCARLAAYLLKKYGLDVDNGLRTHTYWLNVKDGKTGSIDKLNTEHNSYKNCPYYILPHWNEFKEKVRAYYNALCGETKETPKEEVKTEIYRVRKSWEDEKSQTGAYRSLENAKKACKEGYSVFISDGSCVYSNKTETKVEPKIEPKVEPKVETKPQPKAETKKINVIYDVYTSKWLPEVTNYNEVNDNGYAGIKNVPIHGFAAKSSEGLIKYRVHIKNNGWLSWIQKYEPNNWANGCAGLKSREIDAI